MIWITMYCSFSTLILLEGYLICKELLLKHSPKKLSKKTNTAPTLTHAMMIITKYAS